MNDGSQKVDGEPPLRIEFICEMDGIGLLVEPWNALCEASTNLSFFQTPRWCLHIIKTRLSSKNIAFKPCIVTFWRDQVLVGLWPLGIFKVAGQKIVKAVDSPFGQFSGGLFSNRNDEVEGISAAISLLRSAVGADGLMIEKVIAGSCLHQVLSSTGAVVCMAEQSVHIELSEYDIFGEFLATINKKTRKNLRNSKNRLEREGELRADTIRDPAELSSLIKSIYWQRRQWLKQFGMTAPAFRDPDYQRIIETIAAAQLPGLIAFELKLDGKSIAAQWGAIYNHRYYAYISSRDVDLKDFSAGRVHLGMVIEACTVLGLDGLELMAPASEYKLNWSKGIHQTNDFQLAFSITNRLYFALWHRGLRSLLRRGMQMLGDPIRRQVTSLLNRG